MPRPSRMDFTDPWQLTVIRTRGLLFVRPEKSWRPIVSISVVDGRQDHGLPHEVVLGCDGQNPNLKSVIPVHDVNMSTRLVIQVFHKSQTKKKHRKRNLVGSAAVSLNEFLNKHPLPHSRPVDYDIRLSCPPPQRKSPTIGGRQQHNATLTMRFMVPQPETAPCESPPVTPISERHETDGIFSDVASTSGAMSDTMVQCTPEEPEPADEAPWGKQPEHDRLDGTAGLRRRRKRRVKGFHLDSDSDAYPSESSCFGDESDSPPTPQDDYFPPLYDAGCGGEEVVFSPSVLPQYADQISVVSVEASRSFAEACVDRFAPYFELREAEEEGDCEKADKVLGRLLTEWYVVGASLLGLAGIDAAVFGFAPDGLFAVEGFSREAVSIGAIAAGIGLVCDAWFLIMYSGANVQKFQRLAKDVYNTYFFFCLICRLPTVCMFVSALALMGFLFAVAWTAWPTAVLVMSFVAGFLLTSQFLVFGIHRFVNLLVWVVRVCWRTLFGRRSPPPPQAPLQSGPQAQAQPRPHSHAPQCHPGPCQPGRPSVEARIEMPVPEPSPAPDGAAMPKMEMVWAEQLDRSCAD
ncbi:hypothetical protein L226DRAFT_494380 [Lentinus tigrinus ALCF2SS1-7]|uniref:Uncharacterized protein n=1 Tax=Lentinus tigrinus ALCF2SS1-6 TaxID=1328759 RepID=A0A5C2RS79_9APHY|nr:hypothetical protein L227DRAFT_556258 [Lentinus tigrinus ALCF2SS1-6]RPD69362.1 hypothetical protein L226DRAFT_494380 [Lentinus tigrinus ALCF2SS1-7]